MGDRKLQTKRGCHRGKKDLKQQILTCRATHPTGGLPSGAYSLEQPILELEKHSPGHPAGGLQLGACSLELPIWELGWALRLGGPQLGLQSRATDFGAGEALTRS